MNDVNHYLKKELYLLDRKYSKDNSYFLSSILNISLKLYAL